MAASTFRWLVGLALATALTACGGGGGGGSPTTVTDGGGTPGTINPGSNTGTDAVPGPGGGVSADQGVEFRVNTTTALSQESPAIARFPDGGYVVVWVTRFRTGPFDVSDDPRNGIFAQRYGADGAPVGGETRIDTHVAGRIPEFPKVTTLVDGGYLVAWHVRGSDGFRGDLMQRVRPDGSRGHFSEAPAHSDFQPGILSMAGLASGGYVVLRTLTQSVVTNIWVQRYSADDIALDQPQRVNMDTTAAGGGPVVAMPDGGFLTAWSGATSENVSLSGLKTDIYTRRFDADGTSTGPDTRVTQVGNGQLLWSVAVLKGGGYALAWRSDESQDLPGHISSYMMTQTFRADGSAIGSPTRVDPASDLPGRPAQLAASAGALEDGGYVVAWQAPDRPGHIYARRYDAQGSAVGPVIRATSAGEFPRESPMAVGLGNGGFVVGWRSEGEDGDMGGIYARQWGTTGLR